MKNRKRYATLPVVFLFAVLLFAFPAAAKTSTAWRSAYKSFLAEGSFTGTSVRRSHDLRGNWYDVTTVSDIRIDKFALVNIDGKGQPELLLFEKEYPLAGKSFNQYIYLIYVARMKGKKVQVLPFGTTTVRAGSDSDKKYTYNNLLPLAVNNGKISGYEDEYYIYDFNLDTSAGGGVWYYSANKALVIGSPWKYKSNNEGYTGVYMYYLFYKLSGSKISNTGTLGLLSDGTSYASATFYEGITAPSYVANFKTSQAKAVKIYKNSKSNRNKLGNGKITPVS